MPPSNRFSLPMWWRVANGVLVWSRQLCHPRWITVHPVLRQLQYKSGQSLHPKQYGSGQSLHQQQYRQYWLQYRWYCLQYLRVSNGVGKWQKRVWTG